MGDRRKDDPSLIRRDLAPAFVKDGEHLCLLECSGILLGLAEKSASDIFGSPDELKLRSSMTLFSSVAEAGSVFHHVLEEFFDGEPDSRTTELLRKNAGK